MGGASELASANHFVKSQMLAQSDSVPYRVAADGYAHSTID